ncbi:MAG: transposase, partial [Methylocystis sp.]
MDLTRDTLPDDPEKLKAMIAELLSARTAFEAEVATLQAANLDKQARIDRLQLLLKTIQRATYGRSSEKLDGSQYAFAFEEVQTALGEIEVQLDRLESKNKKKP